MNLFVTLLIIGASVLQGNTETLIEFKDLMYAPRQDCPSGSFVMKRSGNYLQCTYPNRTQTTTISFPDFGDNREYQCGIGPIRGLDVLYSSVQMPHFCVVRSEFKGVLCSTSSSCGSGKAMSGVQIPACGTVNPTLYFCTDVGNPADLCDPSDKLDLILVCDMLEASAPSECRYLQTIGYGNSSSMSQNETAEYHFYKETNFDFGFSGYGLKANFGRKIKESNTTGYNWSTASEQTWRVETTTEVTLSVPGGIKTSLFQAVGKCSFYSVSTNFYKRVDTNSVGQIVTESTFSVQ